jgi:methyl-CpG-binding domain protein 4
MTVPPISPYGLIQEQLFPNEWLILVSCVMLNCTTRKQVEKVLPKFIERWPTPQSFMKADMTDVGNLVGSLGFARRRAIGLMKMTEHYLTAPWQNARELPAIGEYGHAAHQIFCRGDVPLDPPNDHALKQYVIWYNKTYRSSH